MSEFVYRNILVDINNIFNKNHEKLRNMTYQVGEFVLITGGVYGSIRSLWKLKRQYLESHPDSKMYMLFDNAKSKEGNRKLIDPSYKLNRNPKPKSFYRSLDYLRLILLNSSPQNTIVYGTGYEADDIAPYVIDSLDSSPCLVVSEDLDWSRLIGWKGRKVHHLMKDKIFDSVRFNQNFDFEPSVEKITLYKAIRGDSTDNIPIGIRGLQKDKVIRLIEDFSTVDDMLYNVDHIEYLSPLMRDRMKESAARLRLNQSLVEFIPIKEKEVGKYTFRGRYSPRVLKVIYESLGFDIDKLDSRINRDINTNSKKGEDDFFIQPRVRYK